MKNNLLLFILIIITISFSCREKVIDKSTLLGNDYRLFQETPAWNLAKAVQDENENGINEIVAKNPKLINYQEPKYGNTLLILTIMNQQMKPFKILLEHKADISIHNTFDGTSALIEACSFKQYDNKFAEILIEYGANANDVETGERRKGNSTRFTPLMAASREGNIDLVKLIVSKGAEMNYKNEFNQSALSEAILLNHFDVVLYLLQNGADYSIMLFDRSEFSSDGKKMYIADLLREDLLPLESKEFKQKMKVVEFLKQKGIDYRRVTIPDYVVKEAKENYPNNWQEYLDKY